MNIKIIYWIATGLMSIVFLFSAGMYLSNYEMVTGFFKNLGFPTWLVYPMAILKILGVVAVISKKSNFLKDLAYSGFLYNGILALASHVIAKDGGYMMSLVAVIATCFSWFFDKKLFGEK
jgi:pheromone shutdown protein TraB